MIIKGLSLVVQTGGKKNVIGDAEVEIKGDVVEIHGHVTNPAFVRMMQEHPGDLHLGSGKKKAS